MTDQITVYDTAIQKATTDQSTQASASATGCATGTSLQMCQVSKHPNAIKHCEERQLHQVFLPKELAVNSNIIGPFMYNEELEFFIAKFRKTNSARWPYLKHAVNNMYKKYYQ